MTETAANSPDRDDAAWGFDTLQIHAGAAPDAATGARATPIYASTSFIYESSEQAAASFALDDLDSYAYTRMSNPTTSVVEQRIARLENGAYAIAVASGQAATALAILNIVRSGDHVVVSKQIYGGTLNLILGRFSEIGITATLVDDLTDLDEWRAAARPETRAFLAESIGNPTGAVLDIAAVADVAHAVGVPLVVDNTLATPYLVRPLDHGADIVVHSTTKFLSGHGTVIGGVIVDGGSFDYSDATRWPGFSSPIGQNPAGYWERFSGRTLAYSLRLRTTVLRDYGPAVSPFNSFLLIQGLETLSLRMRQHVANARAIVAFLQAHPLVERVHYPEATGNPSAELAARYLPRGAGAIVSFEIAGGRDAGATFVESLRLFSHLANIGDVRSLVIHPASTTHSGMTPDQQRVAGISPSLVRLSIGLEDSADLVADLDQALAASAA